MINPIIGQFEAQPPVSKALQSTQAPANPAETPQIARVPQGSNVQDATLSPGKTEEINAQLALSRDVSRIDPSQVFNSSQQRGAAINILA